MSKYFDPHKSFLSLAVLKVVVGFAVVLAMVVSLVITMNSSIEIDLSYSGFNDAVRIFSVPLGILALIIPVVALLAANHRSEQTKEQMRLAGEQNNFSNYYKHLEEFEKYIDSAFEKEKAKISWICF